MGDKREVLRVGSRKSELALIQTNLVIESLKELMPGMKFEIVTMSTLGDEILDRPIVSIGEKSLFTKELETALTDGRVDLVVHSLKDMPTSLPTDLVIGAISQREDPRDAVILHPKHRGLNLSQLPKDSVIGTSSLRRRAQLRKNFPSLQVESIRGNLQTRLRKLDQGQFDAIILAVAGVNRMGWEHRIAQILEESEMLYAVGQGALGVECRRQDAALLLPLSDAATALCTTAERSLLASLNAGCSAPVAVASSLAASTLSLTASVLSLDGKQVIEKTLTAQLHSGNSKIWDGAKDYCGYVGKEGDSEILIAHKLGSELADALAADGALEVIAEAKNNPLS